MTGPLVTGVGAICAIGRDVPGLATALRQGRSAGAAATIGDVAVDDRPEAPYRHAARVTRRASRPVRAAAVAALEAWTSADLHRRRVAAERVALVVAGHNLTAGLAETLAGKLTAATAYVPPRFALQMLDTDHVGVLSEILDVRGEGFTVGAASASGNLGLIAGSRLIESDAADVCVVVGALQELSTLGRHALLNVGALAPAAGGAPFDHSANGFVAGEASACLVLESAGSVAARGVRPRAELRGYAQRLDANCLADPSHDGELGVMRAALARARLAATDVDYVNAHGTGSPLGDEIEARALRDLFDGGPAPWVNATKGLTGHCLSAAGVLEAVATIVQLEGGFVHPNAGLRDPLDTGLRLVGERAQRARIVHALSNGFGFGGINSAVVVSAV